MGPRPQQIAAVLQYPRTLAPRHWHRLGLGKSCAVPMVTRQRLPPPAPPAVPACGPQPASPPPHLSAPGLPWQQWPQRSGGDCRGGRPAPAPPPERRAPGGSPAAADAVPASAAGSLVPSEPLPPRPTSGPLKSSRDRPALPPGMGGDLAGGPPWPASPYERDTRKIKLSLKGGPENGGRRTEGASPRGRVSCLPENPLPRSAVPREKGPYCSWAGLPPPL